MEISREVGFSIAVGEGLEIGRDAIDPELLLNAFNKVAAYVLEEAAKKCLSECNIYAAAKAIREM